MRLAHASDLHLLSLAGARVLDFANKRWIGGMNLLTNRGRHYKTEVFEAMIEDLNAHPPDHLLVTGDLTNLALDEEFRFARELFDRIALRPEQVTVIPGNHDCYVARGAEYFAHHFEVPSRPDDGWAWPDGDRWPVVRVRGDLALVCLSTSRQTPWFTAYGLAGTKQLERLEAVLGDARLAGCFRLVAIHHPPAGKRARSVIRGLRDHAQFAAVLARTGCDLVLHGHEHKDLYEELPGPRGAIAVRGIQSGTYDAANEAMRARYRIYELGAVSGRPGVVGETLRRYDPDRGRFAEESSAPRQISAKAG